MDLRKGLAALAAAIALGAATTASASVTYLFFGQGSGFYEAVGVPDTPHAFSGVNMDFYVLGQPPGTDIGYQAKLIPLTSGVLFANNLFLPLALGPDAVFAIGENAYSGEAAFGSYDGTTLTPNVLFTSAGLDGYYGVSALATIPVQVQGLAPFGVYYNGQLYEISLDSVTNAGFSATEIPEPSAWAMMLAGFALLGGALRRRSHGVAA